MKKELGYKVESATLRYFRAMGVISKEYGEAVLAEVRAMQRRELRRARPKRSEWRLKEAYAEAMAEKRAAMMPLAMAA